MKKIESNLIIHELLNKSIDTVEDLAVAKRRIAKKFGIGQLTNIDLLKAYHKLSEKEKSKIKNRDLLESFLKTKQIRSSSGVAVISVLTKSYPCPGNCLYCPTEKGMPKSYLSNEPAVMRAIMNGFDPQRQFSNRLEALKIQGHPTDKIELIVIGGTWSFLPKKYQEWFIKKCFDAANGKTCKNLEASQKKNEKAKNRIIGITIETRPDYINEKEILRLRKLGVTRVELGVQSIYEDVLKFNLRGNTVKDIIFATELLKNAGLKICYHMMPNLPLSDIDKDRKMFETIFSDQNFQPDLLKIYSCAVLKEAPLYKLWQQGKYKPYTEKELTNLLLEIKKLIPYYCRIQRLTRDIPSDSIVSGPAKISNMRQILEQNSKKQGWKCKCIRCREVGQNYNPKEKLQLFRQDYMASGGKEIFLSFESEDRQRLYSLLRLRIPPTNPIQKIIPALCNSAIIRELHTYGQLHPLQHSAVSPQHKGLGKKLIEEAEKIAKKEFAMKNIAVISGIGAREYYKKFKYRLKDTYMFKKLT